MYIGYQRIPVSGTVLTASALTIPAKATHAEIQAEEAGAITYTMDDATDPGNNRGMVLPAAGDPKLFLIEDIRRIRFFDSGAATALNIAYIAGRDI